MSIFIIAVSIIALLFLFINLLLAPHNPYQEKDTAFECGFHSFQQSRSPFNIAFFIYALLYLLFDLEILLIFPYSVSAYANGIYGLIGVLMFILLVTAGFVFEIGKNALNIQSRQNSTQGGKITTDKEGEIITYPLENLKLFYTLKNKCKQYWSAIKSRVVKIFSKQIYRIKKVGSKIYISRSWFIAKIFKPVLYMLVYLSITTFIRMQDFDKEIINWLTDYLGKGKFITTFLELFYIVILAQIVKYSLKVITTKFATMWDKNKNNSSSNSKPDNKSSNSKSNDQSSN